MNLLIPGTYMAADSTLHRLDPRVKMGAALSLMALPFAAPSLGSNLLLSTFVAILAFLSAAPRLALLRTLRTVLWIGALMFIFSLFTTPGRVLVAVEGITVTQEGLVAGMTQVYRLCLLVIIASLLTFTTSPTQLAHGLDALLRPLTHTGLPVRELTMALTIALRFVPTLFEEIDKIVKAQRARGADTHSRWIWQRIRNQATIFVPMFVSAFRRADELATAMEARGFRGARHRTQMRQLRLTSRDLVACLVVLAASVAILCLERLA